VSLIPGYSVTGDQKQVAGDPLLPLTTSSLS
jgi:hypothetical protein